MKAQLNIEYLAAAFLYVSALGTILFLGIGDLPQFSSNTRERSLNLKAEQMTTNILTTPGRYDTGSSSGTAWQKHPQHVTSFGLASGFLQVEREKLMELSTVSVEHFNYSQFKRVTGADFQYRFRFSWRPVVETFRTFQRCSPPDNIVEPTACDGTPDTPYERSGNTVHYGIETLNGTQYAFLAVSHNGIYNATYVTTDREDADSDGDLEWDFRNSDPLGENDDFQGPPYENEYTVREIDEGGSLLVLDQHLKTFGASLNTEVRTIKFNRYASMEGEPLLAEVWTW